VINVPVKEGNRVLGTLNFLREAGAYQPGHVDLALGLTLQAKRLL
jgi:hypothetical protein